MIIEPVQSATVRDVVPLLAIQFREHDIALSDETIERAVRGLVDVNGRGRVIAAYEEGRAIGVAVLAYTWTLEHGGLCTWLDELYVIPERRGAGIGTALLHEAMRVAEEDGCLAMDLEVDAEHVRAERLYEREGFARRMRNRFYRSL